MEGEKMETKMRSESIGKLAEALAKAQGAMRAARKDSDNPFFKSKYADLASCWEAVREPLSNNGLAIIQTLAGDHQVITIETTLAHTSGEWIQSNLKMHPLDSKPTTVGATITYGRRFALQAIVGIATSENEEEVEGLGKSVQAPPPRSTANLKPGTKMESAHDGRELKPGDNPLPATPPAPPAPKQETPIAPEPPQQSAFNSELYEAMKRDRVTPDALKKFLVGKGYMKEDQSIDNLGEKFVKQLLSPNNWSKVTAATQKGI